MTNSADSVEISQEDQSNNSAVTEPKAGLIEQLCESICDETFDRWYREREVARNIREGQHYFNGPSEVKPALSHSPSQLLQCSRQIVYKQENAPEESQDPEGIFWFGKRFENDIVVPYFEDVVVGSDEYVTNSIWIDFSIESEIGELRIKGATDPVIVDRDAKPLVLTEIKTKQSVSDLQSPSVHHQAQAHAYMKGLSEKYDRRLTTAIILYGGRVDLNIRAFEIQFDPWFWSNTVARWAKTHSLYRLNNELPPADPEYDWECEFCAYRERCGQGEHKSADVAPTGLLPGFTEYPRRKLVEYLKAHENAKLTPSLGHQYPELASEYGVYDWECRQCGATHKWDSIQCAGAGSEHPEQPPCPSCSKDGVGGVLAGPPPIEQSTGGVMSDG